MSDPRTDRTDKGTSSNADPRLLVFACRWCAGVGADAAGKERLALPPSFRVIAVDCAGFVEPDLVIRALGSDIDGVAVMGCHLGGCRFNDANHSAFKRLSLLRDLLDAAGLGRDRLQLSFGTAHEGYAFAAQLAQCRERLAQLPPLRQPPTGFAPGADGAGKPPEDR